MDFFIENWGVIVAVVAIVSCAVVALVKFARSGRASQIESLRQWLLLAVTEEEKSLGSGTGKLKLRQAYDMFLTKFPWLAKVIPFEQFSSMVDDALTDMNNMLNSNTAVQSYVSGSGKDSPSEG